LGWVFQGRLHNLVLSPIFQDMIFSSTTGAGREGLPKNNLEQFIIPIIPLGEQKEIVKKIENLFKICDELEEQINKHAEDEALFAAYSIAQTSELFLTAKQNAEFLCVISSTQTV